MLFFRVCAYGDGWDGEMSVSCGEKVGKFLYGWLGMLGRSDPTFLSVINGTF